MYLLFILLFPLLIGSALLIFKPKNAFAISLAASIIELAATAFVLKEASLNPVSFSAPWVAEAGLSFSLYVDGISGVLIGLCALLVPFIVATTANTDRANNAQFQGLMLAMQTALMGAFLAKDAFLFYFFFEASLLPIYFLAAIYGGENKNAITFKFFVYTLFGSLFFLIALVYVYLQTPGEFHSADIEVLYQTAKGLSADQQGYLFAAFFLAFAIKMPVFPFHTWQPDTYTVAPAQGTMLLSGIMLKMGIYGVIRWLIPVVPQGFEQWKDLAIILSVIGIVYASVIAFKQKDIKRLVAYSSIAHVGLISAGIFAWNIEGIQGALIQMLSHGINVIGLFYVMDIIINRLNTREIALMGGIAKVAPKFAIAFLIILLGTVALPLTNGFIGEFLLLNAVYQYQIWFAAIAGLTIIFGAVYMLRMYKNVMQGTVNELTATFKDISGTEVLVLGLICALQI